ncbi:MAG: type II secretion system protein [Planctomycetales bacterium]|nr:type II secretion system protein [Planctomycetales bacterium]
MFSRSRKILDGGHRPSFTLIELLVSIAIIGLMVSMVLFTLAGAQQDALRGRTRKTIEKLNAVILERWEGYRYRSVKIPIPNEYLKAKKIRPIQMAAIRAVLLKDMMRMEMPDRITDLTFTPTNVSFALSDGPYTLDDFGGRFPSREYNLLRNYFNLVSVPEPYSGAVTQNSLAMSATRSAWTLDNQSAECLYAIVAHSSSGGGSALEGFHASEIGDTDGDGYPEFLDGWGNAIGWIRWPAGYPSDLNLSYKLPEADPAAPDAFDPLRTDQHWGAGFTQKPWTLVPLIVSRGGDELPGINPGFSTAPADAFAMHRNAYYPSTDAPAIGQITNLDETSDNVTNHDLLLE